MNADTVNSPCDGTVSSEDLQAARAKRERELLELAAKAAGIEGDHFSSDLPMHTGPFIVAEQRYWNPLVDDRDALRLAVKLGISILLPVEVAKVEARRLSFDGATRGKTESTSRDPYAATRRVIVRAAAEMGAAKGADERWNKLQADKTIYKCNDCDWIGQTDGMCPRCAAEIHTATEEERVSHGY